MNKALYADPDKCTGCNRCASVCAALKTGAFAPTRAHIRINNYPHHGFSAPSLCFQCPSAACHKACPSDAISRNAVDALVVDAEKCTACGSCIAACPYGMIELAESGAAAKCDLCNGDPACVKECFPGALSFAEKTPELIRKKGAQMKQRSNEGRPAEKRARLGKALLSISRG